MRYLELHHEEPYARGGPATETNIRLVYKSHNALVAEENFGRDLIAPEKGQGGSVASASTRLARGARSIWAPLPNA
jgi:hypothetical protein